MSKSRFLPSLHFSLFSNKDTLWAFGHPSSICIVDTDEPKSKKIDDEGGFLVIQINVKGLIFGRLMI